MAKIITITGPESTGKSTLAKALAANYDEPWVQEYAREYLDNLGRPYVEADLIEIAMGQHKLIAEGKAKATEFLFVDTDAWTICIWSKVKYGRVDPGILQLARREAADHYLLCGIDVPWENDPLREHPNDRPELLKIYKDLLVKEKLNFTQLSGDPEVRLHAAIDLFRSNLFLG